jgi:hypothetical protein
MSIVTLESEAAVEQVEQEILDSKDVFYLLDQEYLYKLLLWA